MACIGAMNLPNPSEFVLFYLDFASMCCQGGGLAERVRLKGWWPWLDFAQSAQGLFPSPSLRFSSGIGYETQSTPSSFPSSLRLRLWELLDGQNWPPVRLIPSYAFPERRSPILSGSLGAGSHLVPGTMVVVPKAKRTFCKRCKKVRHEPQRTVIEVSRDIRPDNACML